MTTSPSDPRPPVVGPRPWEEWLPYWEGWPPSDDEAERQFAQSVGPFVYVPLPAVEEELPEVLLRREAPDEFTSDPRRNL